MTSLTHDSPELAETYDRISDSQLAGGKRLVERLAVRAGERVLDVGCGTGRLTRWIADITGPNGVVGIDPLVDRVRVARAHHPGLSFEVGQAEDLGAFEEGSFDVVGMSAVFHWVEDKPKALREARRVLKPGGRFGLTTPARELRATSTAAAMCISLLGQEPYGARLNPAGSYIAKSGCTVTELLLLLTDAGLEVLELHLVRRTQLFSRGKDVVDFMQASTFGNFGQLVTEDVRDAFLGDLAAAFDARKGPDGISLHDHGVLAVASRG